ncbi:MAG: bifunctional YncE family protein/alkaline phosphatase family protein, partial [Fibrella sp.]|nr:bifunctional YncE family protein/alkaline phosphatase family protein [Armatimonadota bacterium]
MGNAKQMLSRKPLARFGSRAMRGAVVLLLLALLSSGLPSETNDKRKNVLLTNGWRITPVGILGEKMGDTLLGCALSPDGKTLAISNAGAQTHYVSLVDTTTGKVFFKSHPCLTQSGLVWSPNGRTLYASGGITPQIHVYTQSDTGAWGEYYEEDTIPLPDLAEKGSSYLAGMAVSPDGETVYIANLVNDTVYAIHTDTRKVRATHRFDTGARPGCLRTGKDGALYVTLWAKAQVAKLDGMTLESKRTVMTGKHPNDILFHNKTNRIFVSCGNSDAVFVHDARTGEVSEQIRVSLTPESPPGTTPSALALSPDGETLFVSNADNNDVAVVAVAAPGRSRVRGFIPTAHYPTIVAVSADGKRLFIGSSKGIGTGPNGQPERGKIDPVMPRGYPYITQLMSGVLQNVAVPDDAKLAEYTRQVLKNTPYKGDAMKTHPPKAPESGENPVPSAVGEESPIRHVLYIIKENRSYDQVLGDMRDKNGKPIGNG